MSPPLAPDAHTHCERGVVLPKPRKEVRAEYTAEARQKKITGGVLMRGEVKVDGTVGEVQVLRSLDPGLDREAVRAFRHWTFERGTYMGEPASIIAIVELTFSVR
jgi:protein TonB